MQYKVKNTFLEVGEDRRTRGRAGRRAWSDAADLLQSPALGAAKSPMPCPTNSMSFIPDTPSPFLHPSSLMEDVPPMLGFGDGMGLPPAFGDACDMPYGLGLPAAFDPSEMGFYGLPAMVFDPTSGTFTTMGFFGVPMEAMAAPMLYPDLGVAAKAEGLMENPKEGNFNGDQSTGSIGMWGSGVEMSSGSMEPVPSGTQWSPPRIPEEQGGETASFSADKGGENDSATAEECRDTGTPGESNETVEEIVQGGDDGWGGEEESTYVEEVVEKEAATAAPDRSSWRGKGWGPGRDKALAAGQIGRQISETSWGGEEQGERSGGRKGGRNGRKQMQETQPAAAASAVAPPAEESPRQGPEPITEPITYTTVMLRNIPNKYTREMLVKQLQQDFKGRFDFLYLPIDFKNRCNVGYAFLNFIDVQACAEFVAQFHGVDVRKCLPGLNSKKVVEVTPARVQGLEENVRRLRNGPVMHELIQHPEWMPLILDEEGEAKPFPLPDAPCQPTKPKKGGRDDHHRGNSSW